MKKNFLLPAFVIILSAAVISCKKGDTGPAGPIGPAGATGTTGATGATGTANVIYSDWFTPGAYSLSTVFGLNNLNYTKATADITQDVLDKGVVLTYGKLSGYNTAIWPTNQVAKLPIVLNYISGDTQTDSWSAYETLGNLRINFQNNTNYYTSISTSHSFRYIIIPGAVSNSRVSLPDFNDYDAVCKFYNIQK